MNELCASASVGAAERGVGYKPLKREQLSQSLAPGTVVVDVKDTVGTITPRAYRISVCGLLSHFGPAVLVSIIWLRINLMARLIRMGTNTIVQLSRDWFSGLLGAWRRDASSGY